MLIQTLSETICKMFSTNFMSTFSKQAIAVSFGAISGVSLAFASLFIDMSVFDVILITWYRMVVNVTVFGLWFFIGYCRSSNGEDLRISLKDTVFIILYGLFESLASIFGNLSFRYIPFADANAIFLSSPALIGILSRCFIGTPCGIIEVIVTILSTSGLILTLQPEFLFGDSVHDESSNRIKGNIYAVITLLSISMYYIISQYIKHIRCSVTLSVSALMGFIICSLCVFPMGSFRIPETRSELLLLVGICSLMCASRFFLYRSFLFGAVFATKIGRMLDVPTSYCLQCLIQHKYPSSMSIVGVTLIVIASLIFVMKDLMSRNNNSDEGKSDYSRIENQDECEDTK
ncbi:Uncharacterised protein at_DN1334 [Pycnogonum litorale]